MFFHLHKFVIYQYLSLILIISRSEGLYFVAVTTVFFSALKSSETTANLI